MTWDEPYPNLLHDRRSRRPWESLSWREQNRKVEDAARRIREHQASLRAAAGGADKAGVAG